MTKNRRKEFRPESGEKRVSHSRDRFITVNNLVLHYLEWDGRGEPPMLLLHGATGHAHLWDAFAPAFTDSYRVIALDQRGHGESGWASPPAYGAEDYVADLAAFIDSLGLGEVTLIGHSMGALHATIYAATYPDRVRRLVFIDIEACPQLKWREYLRKGGQRPRREFSSLREVVEREFSFFTGPSPHASRELLDPMAAYGTKRLPNGRLTYRYDRATIALWDDYDVRPYLPKIPCRVLFVRGAESPVLSREIAQEISQAFSGGELVEVESAGHMVMLDNPTGLAKAVHAFLSESR